MRAYQQHYQNRTIDIRDTGIGIPPDKLEHVSDACYQVNGQTNTPPGVGLGLGLAIVKEVARLLHTRPSS